MTHAGAAGTIKQFSQRVFAWLSESLLCRFVAGSLHPVFPQVGGDRAETPLLDLVRAGIENDFERVVFPEYPDLREVKRVLEREGARYASLVRFRVDSVWSVFGSAEAAQAAAERMSAAGHSAVATTTWADNSIGRHCLG